MYLIFTYVILKIIDRFQEPEVTVQCIAGHELVKDISRTTLHCINATWYTTINPSTSIERATGLLPPTESYPFVFATDTTKLDFSRVTIETSNQKPTLIHVDGETQNLYVLQRLDCNPVCEMPCQNNGTCIGPEKCECIPGYAGAQCQVAKCSGAPYKIRNSVMIFRYDMSITLTCISIY